MTAGWEVKELGAVSAINYGYTASDSSEPVGPRFLRITDIQDDRVDWDSVPYCKIDSADMARYRLASGDIVFARTGATTALHKKCPLVGFCTNNRKVAQKFGIGCTRGKPR